jgi:hypothetical protein
VVTVIALTYDLSQCTFCQEPFPTAEKRTYHQRNCNPFPTLNLPQGKVTVTKNAKGMFICQCMGSGCRKEFNKLDSLKWHLRKTGGEWRDEV